MATFSELQSLVSNIILDQSLEANIPDYLNRAVNEIAGGLPSTMGSFLSPPLPNLFTVGTVETVTDAAFVSMPATYQRNLQFATNSDGVEIDIFDSLIEFAQDYPLMNASGSVQAVVEQGGNLYYQRIPTAAATLTLHFYKFPTEMALNTDIPTCIPLHLQIPLLVNHATSKLYELIEDGADGEGANTARYKALFLEALHTLEITIPADARSFSTLSIGMN